MENYDQIIQQILNQGENSRQLMQEAVKKYPYCTLPILLYLKNNPRVNDKELIAKVAIACPDRKALAVALGKRAKIFSQFYPPKPQSTPLTTSQTIDDFLNSYGNSSDKEIEAINNAIFNPMPDYADILASQEQHLPQQAMSKEDELINSFIENSREQQQNAQPIALEQHIGEQEKTEIASTPIQKPDENDNSMFSESLAKMYIARGKYSKALEIIENINLNFPEKSIYFADQIRFLRKLVLIQNNKNNKNK
ncbi:MAG: hypothetical protein IK117_08585 [Bacteroidales bacterium]|nr:hypothetical protein [Bacteroidales bacterium]